MLRSITMANVSMMLIDLGVIVPFKDTLLAVRLSLIGNCLNTLNTSVFSLSEEHAIQNTITITII